MREYPFDRSDSHSAYPAFWGALSITAEGRSALPRRRPSERTAALPVRGCRTQACATAFSVRP